jgi:hypothetical protein
MDKILEKISSYNIFNYLFPGVVFCVVCDKYFSIPLMQEAILNGIFLYYFVGLVISRIGSVVIEPTMKKLGLLEFSEYSDFVQASKTDSKIEILSEANNMYRTILSMIAILGLTVLCNEGLQQWPEYTTHVKYILIGLLLVIFLFSYVKQTNYITKRVLANKDQKF